jgi:hypothetical protein
MGWYAGSLRRSLPAWVAAAAMLFASAGPLLPGHEAVDRECAAPIVEHDHAAHRLGQVPAPEAGHCAACHLTRIVRAGAPADAFRQSDSLPESAAEPARFAPHRVDLRTDFTRGPPRLVA